MHFIVQNSKLNYYFVVQQRFFLAGMLFLFLGIAFSFSMSFSLILTQMVYIPNSFVNSVVNKTFDANSEEICPIRYTAPQNQSDTINSVRTNSENKTNSNIFSLLFVNLD